MMSVEVSVPSVSVSDDKSSSSSSRVSAGRPAFHFTAPRGWMNDPCAPGYDPATKLFHLMYQWNPKSTEWGNICWGSATSEDMVHWKHAESEQPILSASEPYDCEAVFTGCMLPKAYYPEASAGPSSCSATSPNHNSSILTVAYTSVSHLPFHYTLPHPRGCETVALATSEDGGKTWSKSKANPVVTGEPEGLDVTGFRDPFIATWPALDALRGDKVKAGEDGDDTLYALLSGGIRDKGPCLFLYEVPKAFEASQEWKYLGTLLGKFGLDHTFSAKWAADLGINWECANFMHLRQEGSSHNKENDKKLYIVFGSEGVDEKDHVRKYHQSHTEAPRRVPRATNWLSGSLKSKLCTAEQAPSSSAAAAEQAPFDVDIDTYAGGVLDHGVAYAAASFKHPDGRTVVWVWLSEEDILPSENAKKGYTGCMGIPRELFVQVISDITGTFQSLTNLDDIPSLELSKEVAGRRTATTLGIRPLKELHKLRLRALCHLDTPMYLTSLPGTSKAHRLLASSPQSWELQASIRIRKCTSQVGIIFNHPEDGMAVYAGVVYKPYDETIHVERGRSNHDLHVNKVDDIGAFTLFRTAPSTSSSKATPGSDFTRNSDSDDSTAQDDSQDQLERLELRIFRDHDILEVFANDRFAMSTRVYSPLDANTISIFVRNRQDTQGKDHIGAVVESLDIWEMGTIAA